MGAPQPKGSLGVPPGCGVPRPGQAGAQNAAWESRFGETQGPTQVTFRASKADVGGTRRSCHPGSASHSRQQMPQASPSLPPPSGDTGPSLPPCRAAILSCSGSRTGKCEGCPRAHGGPWGARGRTCRLGGPAGTGWMALGQGTGLRLPFHTMQGSPWLVTEVPSSPAGLGRGVRATAGRRWEATGLLQAQSGK